MGKLILITGGSGSGKSEYAEQRLVQESQEHKFYVATMMVYGKEGQERVAKHRRMRAGKGFETIEQTKNLHEILPILLPYKKKAGVLLECLSNLVANELFAEETLWEREEDVKQLQKKILQDLLEIKKQTSCLIVVSNEIFSDGIGYEASTVRYQRMLGELNQLLAQEAEESIELVYGIVCRK